jgi:chemotaxis protein histidine kinase CheA
MAELTHHMEDLLDKVRKGQLAVTAELIDALLMSLDGLKALKENLGASEPGIDIKPIIAAIEIAAVAGGAAPVAAGREPLDAGSPPMPRCWSACARWTVRCGSWCASTSRRRGLRCGCSRRSRS